MANNFNLTFETPKAYGNGNDSSEAKSGSVYTESLEDETHQSTSQSPSFTPASLSSLPYSSDSILLAPSEPPPTSPASSSDSLPHPANLFSSSTISKQQTRKRTTSPPGSPVEKKRSRIQVTSSIRTALDVTKEEGTKPAKHGLLQFFHKATKEEKDAYQKRETERQAKHFENKQYHMEKTSTEKKLHERELARLRKQRQRQKKQSGEIMKGIRSPGGTKRKVRQFMFQSFRCIFLTSDLSIGPGC